MSPLSRINISAVIPHPAPFSARLAFRALVPATICSDRMTFPDQPLSHVDTVTSYNANDATELVMIENVHMYPSSANLLDQSALDDLSMRKPTTTPTLRYLIVFRSINARYPHLLSRHPDSVAIGHIGNSRKSLP